MLGLVVPFSSNFRYLTELVNSVAAQNSEQWTLLVVDDSVMGLTERQQMALVAHERVSLIRSPTRGGPARAWNFGIEMVLAQKPDVVAVVHADDLLEPNYAMQVLRAHAQYPDAYAIFTSVRTINSKGRSTLYLRDAVKWILRPKSKQSVVLVGDAGLRRVLKGNFIFCPTLSFKARKVESPLFREDFYQTMDLELIARILLAGGEIIGLRDVLYQYRRHPESLTLQNERIGARLLEEAQTYALISEVAAHLGFQRSSRTARRMWIIWLHGVQIFTRAVCLLRVDVARRTLQNLKSIRTIQVNLRTSLEK